MNKLFLFLFILIFSSCDNRVTIIEEEEIELYYTSISVCDCYKSGMSTLSNLIEHKDDVYKILFQENFFYRNHCSLIHIYLNNRHTNR